MPLFGSCTGGYSPEALHALQCSGENRAELEKELTHFAQNSADSLKLRATEFSIGNMPGRYSLRDTATERRLEEKYSNLRLLCSSRQRALRRCVPAAKSRKVKRRENFYF